MREIYLFIVVTRYKNQNQTYPVMFAMIFDSISIEGILKRCTKPLHSCLETQNCETIGETTGNLDAPSRQFGILCECFSFFFFFLFDQVKLQRFNGFRGCFVRVIRCIFAHSVTLYFCGCCYCCYSVGYSALSTIQIPVDFIEFPYDLVLHMHEQCGFYYFVHDSLPEKNHVFPK